MAFIKYIHILLTIYLTAALELTCDPGEEFTSKNLTCDVGQVCNKPTGCQQYRWYKENNKIISSCYQPATTCTIQPDYYGNYTAGFTSSTFVLTINNVDRLTEGIYNCGDQQNNTPKDCFFQVYARPKSVTCKGPEIDKSNNIMVSCTVAKIYPSPVCQLNCTRNGNSASLVGLNITYQNMDPQGDPPYYNTTCNLTLPAYNLGLGSHRFGVNVYPNVTGSSTDVIYGRDSNWTTTITINNPTVRLECPQQEYIQEKKQYNCSCREINNTFVSANIIVDGQTPGSKITGQGNITYNFNATRNMKDITCQATLYSWQSSLEKYTPNVAYGPNNATLVYNQTTTNVIHLCNNALSVTVICKVDEVSPGVVYKFNFNESVRPTNSVSTFTQSVTKGGPIAVTCTGTNSIFSKMTITSTQLLLQVIEPPPSSPIIERYQEGSSPVAVPNGILTVQEGTNKIRCRVDGGYPLVSSLTVTCGSQTQKVMGNVTFLEVNMSRYDSECSCIAIHNSTCYNNNKTTTKLDVQFAPAVLSFMVNATTNQQEITVKRDSNIIFSCVAEGNPIPALSIIKDGLQLASNPDHLLQKFNLSLKFNKTIKICKDAGVYSCQAKAGQNVANKELGVNVMCTHQLDNPNTQNMVYRAKLNGSLDIIFSVIGYPAPQLELYSEHPLNKEAYSLTYTRQRPSFGFVYLKINTVTIKDFQKYSLNISNSEGTLVYNFEIQQAEDDDGPNVGAIVGGVVAGVLAIVLVAVIVVVLRRKGFLSKKITGGNMHMKRQSLPPNRRKDHGYENELPAIVHKNITQQTPYAHTNNSQPTESRDDPPHSHYEEIPDTRYEEIRYLQSQDSDSFRDYTNFDNNKAEKYDEVQYENTATGL